MSTGRRLAIIVASAAAVVVLFFVFRGGDDGDEAAPAPPPPPATTAATTAETTTTEAEPAPPPPPPPPPGPARAPITIRGGEVVGGVRTFKVKQGRHVLLTVNADVSDHVHLHGYDRFADVRPGAPAELRFRASIAGRFEIELEDRHLQIAELEVRP